VMPERVARHYCQHGPFAILPCALPLSVPPVGMITQADDLLSPSTQRFLGVVEQIVREEQ